MGKYENVKIVLSFFVQMCYYKENICFGGITYAQNQ